MKYKSPNIGLGMVFIVLITMVSFAGFYVSKIQNEVSILIPEEGEFFSGTGGEIVVANVPEIVTGFDPRTVTKASLDAAIGTVADCSTLAYRLTGVSTSKNAGWQRGPAVGEPVGAASTYNVNSLVQNLDTSQVYYAGLGNFYPGETRSINPHKINVQHEAFIAYDDNDGQWYLYSGGTVGSSSDPRPVSREPLTKYLSSWTGSTVPPGQETLFIYDLSHLTSTTSAADLNSKIAGTSSEEAYSTFNYQDISSYQSQISQQITSIRDFFNSQDEGSAFLAYNLEEAGVTREDVGEIVHSDDPFATLVQLGYKPTDYGILMGGKPVPQDYNVPNGKCFLPETNISMSDGSYKQIQDIEVGDKILSYDIENKKIVVSNVDNVYSHIENSYLIINDKIKVTPYHMVYAKRANNINQSELKK